MTCLPMNSDQRKGINPEDEPMDPDPEPEPEEAAAFGDLYRVGTTSCLVVELTNGEVRTYRWTPPEDLVSLPFPSGRLVFTPPPEER